MSAFDIHGQYDNLKNAVTNSIKDVLKLETDKYKLQLHAVNVDDSVSSSDYKSQKDAKLKGQTWAVPVYANMSVVDKETGKVVSKADKVRVMNLPKVTDRGSYIINGNEYQVVNQLRLKPGVYMASTKAGDVKAQINLAKGGVGKNLGIELDGDRLMLTARQANIPLYDLLRGLGMSHTAIKEQWGNKATDIQAEKYDPTHGAKAVERFQQAFTSGEPALTFMERRTAIDPISTKAMVGKTFDTLAPDLLARTAGKLIRVKDGQEPMVDRDSIFNKSLHGVEDFVQERLTKRQLTVKNKLQRKLDRTPDASRLVTPGVFAPLVEKFFSDSDKAMNAEQTNPLTMLTDLEKVTILGEGGLSGESHQVTNEMREVHPTHLGYLDPIKSPESGVGTTLHMPLLTKKVGQGMKTPVINLKTGKREELTPDQMFGAVVAFPDQFKSVPGNTFGGGPIAARIKASYRGDTREFPAREVQYRLVSPQQMFSLSVNMIPFLASNQGNRAMMASKHMTQAIPLIEREAPLVQVRESPSSGRTFEQIVGNQFAIKSPVDGTVVKIEKDYLHIRTGRAIEKVPLYNNFHLNQNTFMQSHPTVTVGQKVSKGQLIADSNYTKGGTLALGTHLRTAFVPYKGYNFEDGIVISESAAKKLTSEHIYKESAYVGQDVVLNVNKFRAEFPNQFPVNVYTSLNDDGTVKKGTKVKYGDPLFAGMRTVTQSVGQHIHKNLTRRYTPVTSIWTYDDVGEVIDVRRVGDEITVYVKTAETAKIGDKLALRHGNKGVITHILPDAQAPRNAAGEHVEIMLNPHGVIGRINVGQIYESSAAKVAKKIGKPLVVENFTRDSHLDDVKKTLKNNGLSDKEVLIDPVTKKEIGNVHVGSPYILKLHKQSHKSYSARGYGPGSAYTGEMQPGGSGEEGSKSLDLLTLYAMLSHGSRENLREMSAVKGERNDEYWEALKSGQRLPAPKSPFVFNKFLDYMKAAGVDVQKQGNDLALVPLTDHETSKISKMEIKDPTFVQSKNLKEVKGGFVDPIHLGGLRGTKWGHIALKEAVVNPVFEKPIKSLLGLKGPDYTAIATGQKTVDINGKKLTGGDAIKASLSKIDIDAELTATEAALKKATKSNLDDLNRKYRYLKVLKDNNIRPEEAYVNTKIPVLPPVMRPLNVLPDGSIAAAQVNYLYHGVGLLNRAQQLPVMKLLSDENKAGLRKDMYDFNKGLRGLDTVTTLKKEVTGVIGEISGSQPKTGMFQSKILKKQQDLVGRGVILPEPSLGVDEVGLPKDMLWKLYEPFITKALVRNGMSLRDARKEVESRSPQAQRMLDYEMQYRPVMLNRAPSLHKFSIMGFKPKAVEGKSIKIPSLVVSGFNADFDGDDQHAFILTLVSDPASLNLSDQFVEERDMTARFRATVPAFHEGKIIICDLSEFPRGELLVEKDHRKFYAVPLGVKVLAFNELDGKVVWANVSAWSEHTDRSVELVNLGGGSQIITDNDPRAVYGLLPGTLTSARRRPKDSIGMMVPVHVRGEGAQDSACLKTIDNEELTPNLAYTLGCLISNGWVETLAGDISGRVWISLTEENVRSKYMACVKALGWIAEDKEFYMSSRDSADCGSYGPAKKIGFLNKSLAPKLSNYVGMGARHKHLPPYFIRTDTAFRKALFEGLMDNDGSISVSRGKQKPQVMASYQTASLRLAREVVILARSLNIRAQITASKTPKGDSFWAVSFSTVDICRENLSGMVHEAKVAARMCVEAAPDANSAAAAKADLVPISRDFMELIYKSLGCPRECPAEHRTAYQHAYGSINRGYISRIGAHNMLEYINTLPNLVEKLRQHQDYTAWLSILNNNTIRWEQVVSYEVTNHVETGYDLTVPGYETFSTIDGTILSNTMTVHVPISDKAVREAKDMMPSNHLYKPGTGDMMLTPTNESMLGIYKLSTTPQGRAALNSVLPTKYRVAETLDKKAARQLFNRLSKELPANEFSGILNKVKHLGEEAAYATGSTLGLDDIVVTKDRDKLVADITHAVKAGKDMAAPTAKLREAMMRDLGKHNSGFYHMLASGASSKDSQVQQIVAAPTFVTGYKGKMMPVPITKSYAEGLDTGDYWAASFGARSGMIDRAVQTSEPGAFSKELMSTVVDVVVSKVDCGTHKGIELPIDSTEVYDRHLAGDQHGTKHNALVTPEIVKSLRQHHAKAVKVRSPLTCEATNGVCSMCHGIDERGKLPAIGDNVGAKAGQAIAEPMTQMVMRTFHTGGLAGTGMKKGGFERIEQLLEVPKFVAGEAPIATADGKVTRVEQGIAGLVNIHIKHDGNAKETIYHAPKGGKVHVHAGSRIAKGDVLSEGTIRPQALLATRGMMPAINYIADELKTAYADQKQNISRKTFETILRPVANITKVVKGSPHAPEWVSGDLAPYTAIQAYNSNLKAEIPVNDSAIGYVMDEAVGQRIPVGYLLESKEDIDYLKKAGKRTIKVRKQPVKHEPTLRGINTLPLLKRDWLAHMGYNHIKDAVTVGASEGWKSKIHGYHPIPAFAHAAEFGLGEEGEY